MAIANYKKKLKQKSHQFSLVAFAIE